MRIIQLTASAIVFMVVSGTAYLLIETWSGGRIEQFRESHFTHNVGDDCLGIELATLPVVLGLLACWGAVRLFRMKSIHNEIDDTFKPMITVLIGYARFLLIVVSGIYLIMGHSTAALVHLGIAVLAFTYFYRSHRAREPWGDGPVIDEDEEENSDDNTDHVA